MHGYGNGRIITLGKTSFKLAIDDINELINAHVVPKEAQETPILLGRNFSELPSICMLKDDKTVKFFRQDTSSLSTIEPDIEQRKIILSISESTTLLPDHLGNIKVCSADYEGDALIESSIRFPEGEEYCIPQTIINLQKGKCSNIPCLNLSNREITFKRGKIIARALPCLPEPDSSANIMKISEKDLPPLPTEEIIMGPVNEAERHALINLLNEFRDCFAMNTTELGCSKSTEMVINLHDHKPFSYRPYRMARSEQDIVKDIVEELLTNNIIRESDSDYSSPVLLVGKKNGEQRLCVDYRKLNSLTIKDSHPLPRIDDQIDKLYGGNYLISLDLKSGYHQVPIEESSKRYTAFVTPEGQYEYNRVPFGLSNAPRVFQRLMTRILKPIREKSALYLDDVLLFGHTVEEALDVLREALGIFRNEGLTLNLSKCTFLKTSVTYLGFEIEQGKIRPGNAKVTAVEQFPIPKSVHNIRQFLGLTGYFRHFIKNYAIIAKPLTNLIKKTVPWKWDTEENNAFEELRKILVSRPVLNLFDPEAVTEVHTDASQIGLAGILLQRHQDEKLHPVAYYSRQTSDAEQKYHSYELETLAVVESLRKFRSYLLGTNFIVITDCNSLKATSKKKHLIPRIARWWLELQEFNFEVQYRPGNRMNHVDALSRNPPLGSSTECEVIFKITEADWVLSSQLTDERVKEIFEVLSKTPVTNDEKNIHKNYCLRDGRVFRITARGILWVVPKGMRQRIVKIAHDDFGHFGTEKTLQRLCKDYWFPRMREYIEKYISCCIPCLFTKRQSGRKEGFLHPIPKGIQPLTTFHVDHLGPFPKSKRNNTYLIVGIDAFTKFVFLRAAKSTKTKYVIEYFRDIFATYGTPKHIISDQGSCFTSHHFKSFCKQNNIQHIVNAVATPRANGQVERLNRTILSALLPSVTDEDKWDESVRLIQFSINNVPSKSTGKTPSELMFGFIPRGGNDALLKDEIQQLPTLFQDLVTTRENASKMIIASQLKQKQYYDKKRKQPKTYKEGDLVVIMKQPLTTGTSRKLAPNYSGPMVVKKVLPNDRYIVRDMKGSHRNLRSSKYEKIIAVDRMKPWCSPGGVSDDTGSDSGEDGVVLSSDLDEDEEV